MLEKLHPKKKNVFVYNVNFILYFVTFCIMVLAISLPVLVTNLLLIDASHSRDAVNHKKVDGEQVIS